MRRKRNTIKFTKKNIFNILFILISALLVFEIFFFSIFNKAASNILIIKDFCNWTNSFLPIVNFHLPEKKINSFFNGELIYHKDFISPYMKNNIFDNLSIYKTKNRLIGFTNLIYPASSIKEKENIEFSSNNTYNFIIENGIFINPIELVKPFFSSSVSIVNIYYLNEEEIAVAFRQNYKNNVIPILIYAYSTYLSGRYAFTSNVYKLEIYLDNELIYKRELDKASKKQIVELISTSSRPQFIKFIVSNVSDGEHNLKVKVYDIFNHEKEITKKFNVKSY